MKFPIQFLAGALTLATIYLLGLGLWTHFSGGGDWILLLPFSTVTGMFIYMSLYDAWENRR